MDVNIEQALIQTVRDIHGANLEKRSDFEKVYARFLELTEDLVPIVGLDSVSAIHDAIYELDYLTQCHFYIQGLRDGIRLYKLLFGETA